MKGAIRAPGAASPCEADAEANANERRKVKHVRNTCGCAVRGRDVSHPLVIVVIVYMRNREIVRNVINLRRRTEREREREGMDR